MPFPALFVRPVVMAGLITGVAALSTIPARADCKEDFENLNAVRAQAGPFEVASDVVIENRKADRERRSSLVTQFDAAGLVRMTGSNLLTQPDFVIVGDEGWVADGGHWVPMPAADVAAARARLTAGGYFYADNASDLECLGLKPFEDRSYLAYSYVQHTRGYATRVTAYFDPGSRLPVAGVTVLETGQLLSTTVMRYRFDPAIRIEAPK